MAEHTIIKSDKYVSLGLAALDQFALLPNIFKRISGDSFKYAKDDTISWVTGRVTTARDYEWRTRTAPIILDKIGETKVQITLDTHAVTNEQRTMDIRSFATEIIRPQVEALITRAEGKIVVGLRAANFKTPLPAVYESDDPYTFALQVRKILNANGAPKRDRYFLVGADVENWLLNSNRVAGVNTTPETSRAVREAVIGALAGFTIVPVPALEDNEIFAVASDALVVANVAPVTPDGAIDSALRRERNWSLLHTYSYDPNYQQNLSVLSTFMGVSSVNDELQVQRDATTKLPELVLDANGDPIPTGKNVRGAKGTLTAGARP
jgi:hypothetical protein